MFDICLIKRENLRFEFQRKVLVSQFYLSSRDVISTTRTARITQTD